MTRRCLSCMGHGRYQTLGASGSMLVIRCDRCDGTGQKKAA